MAESIFDEIEIPFSEGEKGFWEAAEKAPLPKENSFFNDLKEYGKTILKGSIEGLSKFGKMMGPTHELPKFEKGKFVKPRTSEEELQQQTENLDIALPTEDESFIQKSLRRGLKELPSTTSFPGSNVVSMVPRTIAAGFIGEGAKDLGAPEWAQSALELTAFIGPDITKKLLAKGKNKDIIEAGLRFGMTESEITPLIQSEFKKKWLTKLSPKRGSTQTALENTKKALGEAYETIKKSPKIKSEITEKQNGKLINNLSNVLSDMPRDLQDKIKGDMADLLNNKITGESLMNFYRDVSHQFSQNKKQLQLLKEPIKDALKSISPEAAKDFDLVNNMYSKYSNIASKLKPNITSDIISAGETLGLISSIAMGNIPAIYTVAGEKAGRKLAQQMLINPRFQQLGKKMVVALNQNKYPLAKKITEDFISEIKKTDPETAKKFEKLSDEELKEFFNH